MDLYTWYQSDVGLMRSSNQDALGCFPEHGLFIVADGMGGHADGHVASRLAVDSLRISLAEGDANGDLGERLRQAVVAAHEKIRAAGGDRAGAAAMGTTVVILKLSAQNQRADWAHVGDSRLYRMRGGALELLTADHTAFGEVYRDASPVPLDLPHTNQLLEALGAGPPPEISIGGDTVRAGDLFLLCSDGLSGYVKPEDLRLQLAEARPLADAGESLLELTRAAGAPDNVTTVLVRVGG